jgi:ParB-like chromosome segregation protein Spo0J
MNVAEGLAGLLEPLKDLKPAKSNPRIGDIEAIMKSYERFGQRKPIVVHKKTMEIIAGNHQYEAAKRLGWDSIAVVKVDDDQETATAYSIADNRIGQLGEWNVEELVAAFESISPDDLENVGFEEIDVEDYRALLEEQIMTSDAVLDPDTGKARLTKSEGNPELAVEKDKTYQEFLERYAQKATRAIILYYQNELYGKMVEGLAELQNHMGLDDHAEVVEKLIKDALKNIKST